MSYACDEQDIFHVRAQTSCSQGENFHGNCEQLLSARIPFSVSKNILQAKASVSSLFQFHKTAMLFYQSPSSETNAVSLRRQQNLVGRQTHSLYAPRDLRTHNRLSPQKDTNKSNPAFPATSLRCCSEHYKPTHAHTLNSLHITFRLIQ